MKFDKIHSNAEDFFGSQIKKYGGTAQGVGWNGDEAQKIRYDQISKLLDYAQDGFSILDFGCGYGYYLDYLNNNLNKSLYFTYKGIDVSHEMIEQAKLLHSEKNYFVQDTKIVDEYDYIVASGIFNLKQDIDEGLWQEYIMNTIEEFNKHSRKGFAFNALTKYSDADKMRDDLYYSDPLYLFDYCKKHFSRNVALLHDYEIYDFTIIVRK